MKNQLVLTGVICASLVLPGCFFQSDEQIVGTAQAVYEQTSQRYEEMIHAHDDATIIRCARLLGISVRPSFWNDLGYIEGAPLYKAAYFIDADIREVSRQMGYLDSRMLGGIGLYRKLSELLNNLEDIIQAIKTFPTYSEEAQYVQSVRLQREQLEEARRNNRLLAEVAAKPIVIHEEKVVKAREPVRIVETCKQTCDLQQKKQKIIEDSEDKCPSKPKKNKPKKEIHLDGKKKHFVI